MMKHIPDFALAMHETSYDEDYQIPPVQADQLIDPYDREGMSLDGVWNFCVDPYETGIRKKWFRLLEDEKGGRKKPIDYDFDQWDQIRVPSCFNTQKKECFFYEGLVWYTRCFSYELQEGKKHVFFMMEGASYECRVWLNGVYVARHLGGSTPFCVEITDFLQSQNRLLIAVNNCRRAEQLPALNTDWFNYGGIYRSVQIYQMPDSFVKRSFVRLVPDGNYDKIMAEVTVYGSADCCRILIPELGIDRDIPLTGGRGEVCISARPQLWSVEDPKLYEVIFQCGNDRVRDEIGFRQISVEGRRILLNGKELFLRGISYHEDHPQTGKTLDCQKVDELLNLSLELGCNFVRLAHYPHSRYTAKKADHLGLLLWEEIPVYWAIDFKNPKTVSDAQNQLRELVLRDRNRASVSIWSVGNENPDTDARLSFMENLVELCHQHDETRPVAAACLVNYENYVIEDRLAHIVDIVGINEYFGWYRGNMEQLDQELSHFSLCKPLVISEFGAGALAGVHGGEDELFTEECQADLYRKQIEVLSRKRDVVCGMTPWILFDFRSPGRTNQFQQGYNRKGLLSPDYQYKKAAFFVLQKYYMRLLETEKTKNAREMPQR